MEELTYQIQEKLSICAFISGRVAKGICRVTAFTRGSAIKALELASALEIEVNDASKAELSLLEHKVTLLNGHSLLQ